MIKKEEKGGGRKEVMDRAERGEGAGSREGGEHAGWTLEGRREEVRSGVRKKRRRNRGRLRWKKREKRE